MSALQHLVSATAVVLAAAGCSVDDDDVLDPVNARDQLAEPTTFHVAPSQTKVSLRASLDRGDQTDESNASLEVTAGQLDVATDDVGALILEDLTLGFEPVALPTDIYPGDLVLTGVHLHLAEPVRCAGTLWADDGEAAFCSAVTDLTLDWNLQLAGKIHPMASQTLAGLAVDVELARDDERLRLDLTAQADGIVWSWSDIAGLSDLWLFIRSYDDPREIARRPAAPARAPAPPARW